MIYRRMFVDQPLPASDLLDSTIAVASVSTLNPLMSYKIGLTDGELQLNLTWTSFDWPRTMGFNVGGATIAAGHYNMMGRIDGEVTFKGRSVPVNAAGFSDHSWGVRRQHLPASRCLFAAFDADFYIMAIAVLTQTDRRMIGYAWADGRLGMVGDDSQLGYAIAEDWFTVAGCDAHLIDEHGRHFHVTGRTIGPSSTQPMGHGKLVHHAVAKFACDGRDGRGILETSFPTTMLPGQVEELGLAPDSWWLRDADAGHG